MSQFFIVPYSLVAGHNAKTIHHISAEHCAQLCVYEENVVCRSFDYHVSTFLHLTRLCECRCNVPARPGPTFSKVPIGKSYEDFTF